MKTKAIVKIVFSSLLIFISIGILSTALIARNIPFDWSIGFSTFCYKPGTENYNVSNGETEVDGIDSISITWVDGKVELIPYDGDKIIITESFVSDNKSLNMRWNVNGNNLDILYRESILWFCGVYQNKTLEVKIPNTLAENMDSIEINVISSQIIMDSINTRELNCNYVSGEVDITNCTTTNLNLSGVSSTVNFSGSASTVKIDTVSGNADIVLTDTTKSLRFDSVSATLTIYLPETIGFKASLDSVSGSISSEFGVSLDRKEITYGDGSTSIDADTVSGNIYLKKTV